MTTIQRLVVVGYITAIAMPPIGFVIGLVLMLSRRVRSKHGLWIVLACAIGVGIWVVVVASGTLNTTNENY